MVKHLPVVCLLALFGVLQVSEAALTTTELYPSCINTDYFPNFSYAKTVYTAAAAPAPNCVDLQTNTIPPPQNITWYYYTTYPPACVNPPALPGDQCCHSTATSTITFTSRIRGGLGTAGLLTLTGTITAGPFQGQTVVKTVPLNLASPNLNCGTPYGQETSVGTATVVITNGPTCANGGLFVEFCPGQH